MYVFTICTYILRLAIAGSTLSSLQAVAPTSPFGCVCVFGCRRLCGLSCWVRAHARTCAQREHEREMQCTKFKFTKSVCSHGAHACPAMCALEDGMHAPCTMHDPGVQLRAPHLAFRCCILFVFHTHCMECGVQTWGLGPNSTTNRHSWSNCPPTVNHGHN